MLGEVCTIVNGGTPKSEVQEYWNGDLNWITPKEMGKLIGKEISSTERKITAQGMKNSSAKLLPVNSIILSSRAPIGHLAINKELMATNQGCKGLVPNKTLNYEYLYHFLYSSKVLLNDMGSGTTFKELSGTKLATLKIQLPPIATQQKIVARLDAIFAEIDTATATAEANANNAEALFQSYLTEVFERGGEGWETKKLFEVSSFDKNQGLHNGIPYIGMENIQSHTTQLINEVDLVEEVKSSTFKFNEAHLLYGRLRPYLNKVYAPNFVGHCSTEIFPIKPFSNLLRDYLKYWFINAKTVDKINATCTGARMPRANMNTVMDFDFPLPPISIQKQLIEYFDSVQNCTNIAIRSYKAKIVELTILKHSVLKKAFSGELIKD